MATLQQGPSRGGRSYLRAVLVIFTILAVCAAGFAAYAYSQFRPPAPSGKEVQLTVVPGSDPKRIAETLEQKGLIRSAQIFTYYLRWKQEGGKFQAGEYAMKPGISPQEIIRVLNQGETAKGSRFTVPEGYNAVQISEKLKESGLGNPAVFLDKVQTGHDFQAVAYKQIPEQPALRHRLEGYLFPATYEFRKGTPETEMIERMLQETDKKLASLPAGWEDQMKSKNLNLHQILTLASLIEKEVVRDEERPLVASVIYNRINKNMKLQIDATVQYMLDKPKERLMEKDLLVDSPYNTYMNPGLPPGPIANPSLESIKAALYPTDTNYLYYVTKKDGSAGHYFAETYEQHLKNIEESKKAAQAK